MPLPRRSSRRSRSRSRDKNSRTPSPYFSRRTKSRTSPKRRTRSRSRQKYQSQSPGRQRERSRSQRRHSADRRSRSRDRRSRSRSRKRSPPRKRSPNHRRRSVSPRRRSQSPKRKSVSPRRRSPSPRRRSPSPKRPSPSPRRRSPSPRRRSQHDQLRHETSHARKDSHTHGNSRAQSPSPKSKKHHSRSRSPRPRGRSSRERSDVHGSRTNRSVSGHHQSNSPHRDSHRHTHRDKSRSPVRDSGRDERSRKRHNSPHSSGNRLPPKPSAPLFPIQDVSVSSRNERSERSQYSPEHVESYRNSEQTDIMNYVSHPYGEQEEVIYTLNDRFRTDDDEPFIPEDNITIGIHRNVKGDESPVFPRFINPKDIVFIRRKDEGENPLYLRDEFQTVEEEIIERRVVQVVGSKKSSARSSSHRGDDRYKKENFEVQRDRFETRNVREEQIPITDRWRLDEPRKVIRAADDDYGKVPDRHSDNQSRKRPASPRREYLERDRERTRRLPDKHLDKHLDSRHAGIAGSRDRFQQDPNDLRHNLGRRKDFADARQRIAERRHEADSLRITTSGDNRLMRAGRVDTRSDRGDIRVSIKREEKPLPDFSKRPGGPDSKFNQSFLPEKFQTEEWKLKPDMVPKGISYFEHDNRGEEGVDYWQRRGRGRGRGFMRGGRGFYPPRGRGFVRGRPYGRPPFRRYDGPSGGVWRHDKFKEVEEDADNKPSSTTEK